MKRKPVVQGKRIETRIRGIEHPKAILARLDFEIRKQLAIDQDRIAKNLRNPGSFRLVGNWVVELAFRRNQPVENRQWNFILAAGQIQTVFELVSDDGNAEQACINIQAIDAHGVIVIPEHRRVLLVGIVVENGLAGHEPVFGKAVAIGGNARPMQVGDNAHLRIAFGSVQPIVDGQEMLLREFVSPFHQHVFVAAHF